MLELDFKRFTAKTSIQPNGCVLWTGAPNEDGYGQFWYQGVARYAHHLAYEHWVGPIPAGLTIDHVKIRGCTSTLCVAAAHLEAVTYHENMSRRHRPDRTKCAAGLHAWIPENLKPSRNGFRCSPCQVLSWQASNRRKKGTP